MITLARCCGCWKLLFPLVTIQKHVRAFMSTEWAYVEKVAVEVAQKPDRRMIAFFSKQDKAPLFGDGESWWKIFCMDI